MKNIYLLLLFTLHDLTTSLCFEFCNIMQFIGINLLIGDETHYKTYLQSLLRCFCYAEVKEIDVNFCIGLLFRVPYYHITSLFFCKKNDFSL